MTLFTVPNFVAAAPSSDTTLPLPPLLQRAGKLALASENDKALAQLKKVKHELRKGDYDDYFYLKGKALFQAGDYRSAEQALSRSLSYRARNSDALHLLGASYRKLQNFELGERALKEAIWFGEYFDYDEGESWLQLSEVFQAVGNKEKYVAALEKASKKSKGVEGGAFAAAFSLARTHLENADYLSAKKVLEPLSPTAPADKLQLKTLYAQSLLLAPRTLLPPKEIGETAASLTALVNDQEASATYDGELKNLAHEMIVRLWLAAGDAKKAKDSFASAKEFLSNSPSYAELQTQLEIPG